MSSNRILVVEDDADIVHGVRLLLESEGYQVDVASNGRAALEVLAHADPLPFVILLDLMMPVMNGFEFREAQLADLRIAAVPVVLMTADRQPGEKGTRIGAAGVLAKPFNIDALLHMVERIKHLAG